MKRMLFLSLAAVVTLSLVAACAQTAPTSAPPSPKTSPSPTIVPTPVAKAVATEIPKASSTEAAKPATTPSSVAVKPLDPPITLKVGYAGYVIEGGLFIANDKGYFNQEGLKLELVKFAAGAQMVAPLISGDLDAGSSVYMPALFNAIARGIGLKIVSGAARYTLGHGGTIFMVRKDLANEIKDYKDLKGRKIATIARQTSGDIIFEKAFARGGFSEKDVDIIELPPPDQNAAMANRSIDVALQTEPMATLGVRQGISVKWKSADDVYPNMELSGWIFSEKLQKDKNEAARRFIVGLLRGVRELNDVFEKGKGNRKEILDIVGKYTGITDESMYKDMISPYIHPDGSIDKKLFADDLQWFTTKGLIQGQLDPNALIDMQYVDYALSRLGKYQ